MDLFIINRYKDEEESSDIVKQEEENLTKLKTLIEERKKANLARKSTQKSEIIIQPKQEEPEVKNLDEKIDKESTVDAVDTETRTVEKKEEKSDKPAPEFKVLGINEFEKKVKVRRVLPHWLSHPLIISTTLQDLTTHVSQEDWLHPTLKQILLAEGITHLFPVQKAVAPFIVDMHKHLKPFWPNDVCVSAPTGSGKTLAFVLPIVQVLLKHPGRAVRALIVLPVQELAQQVAKVFRRYCARSSLNVALLSANTPFSQEQKLLVKYTESHGWVSEVDIVVCTAGRLVEHLWATEGFSLRSLQFLVIDEADRIMDNIQNDWLYHLDNHIKLDTEIMTGKVSMLTWNNLTTQKRPPHKLLFSATLSQDPEKLQQWGLFQPKLFSASSQKHQLEEDDDEDNIRKYTTPDELTEQCILCEVDQKPLILYHLLVDKKWNRVLCFANAAQSAHRLAVLLNNMGGGEIRAAEISAALGRQSREAVLKRFHAGEINVLVSTDALARGIDVPLCDYVVSYDPPKNIKTYIHRVGRTGRAGRNGVAVTMLMQNQTALFKNLLNSAGRGVLPEIPIPEHIYEEFAENYERAMEETKNEIHNEIDSKVKKSIALKRGFKSKNDTNKRKRMRTN